ncbi:hypothetical protein B9T33_10410 [Acinetobacter sp. ANC 5054]|nr:hypothetical protein B9T33_10410 [Acinetobacter sp. ANC 5054]
MTKERLRPLFFVSGGCFCLNNHLKIKIRNILNFIKVKAALTDVWALMGHNKVKKRKRLFNEST